MTPSAVHPVCNKSLPGCLRSPQKACESGFAFDSLSVLVAATSVMILFQRKRHIALLGFCLVLFGLGLWSWHRVHRLVASHSFDLSYGSIFGAQFRIYLLTHDCGRFTAGIASTFESVVLVPDAVDAPDCVSLNHTILHVDSNPSDTADEAYKAKYSAVLDDCYTGSPTLNDGGKMKCLILEDDVVLLHDSVRTREVLVENTLTLFNHEDSAYDCTKRGFGWLKTTHTGQGSQCRVFSRPSSQCLGECVREPGHEQLDFALRSCQERCGLVQRRFLLAVHGGLESTMGRSGEGSG